MMMEPTPSSTFIMPKPDLLLELLIVALNAPTQFGKVDQIPERDIFWKSGEPVFDWLFLGIGPLDQQPFFGIVFGRITVPNANADAREPRRQPVGRAFPPLDHVPIFRCFFEGYGLHRDQVGLAVAPCLWR